MAESRRMRCEFPRDGAESEKRFLEPIAFESPRQRRELQENLGLDSKGMKYCMSQLNRMIRRVNTRELLKEGHRETRLKRGTISSKIGRGLVRSTDKTENPHEQYSREDAHPSSRHQVLKWLEAKVQEYSRVSEPLAQNIPLSFTDLLKILSEEDLEGLKNQTGKSDSRELYQYIFSISEQPRGEITQHKKEMIREFLTHREQTKDDCGPISERENQHLQQITLLSKKQVNDIIHRLLNPPKRMTESKKKIISQWMLQKQRVPDGIERDELMQKADLSRRQLVDVIGRLRREMGL